MLKHSPKKTLIEETIKSGKYRAARTKQQAYPYPECEKKSFTLIPDAASFTSSQSIS